MPIFGKGIFDMQPDYFLDYLDYCPFRGYFIWKSIPSHAGKAKIGTRAGSKNKIGYIVIGLKGKRVFAHRLAWRVYYGYWPKDQIDHINGFKDDNRISNLREATSATNIQNQRRPRSNNKSGYLGVCWDKRMHKWVASVRLNGKTHVAGYFDDPKLAYMAYVQKKRVLHEACTI
jgi:hypothetical protein